MIPSLSLLNRRTDSYYDSKTFRMSPAMIRARQPYMARNVALLFGLGAIPMAVYAYTYHFLHTDDLADIPVPPLSDEQVAALQKEYAEQKAADAAKAA